MYLLGVDIETTGLDFTQDEIIEVGSIVWDTSTNKPIEVFSQLVDIGNRSLPQKIIEMTGISDLHLKSFGRPLAEVLTSVFNLADDCDFIVGHNALRFDKKFLSQSCSKLKLNLPKKPWIDTTIDIEYPADITTRKLSYLAAEHGLINSQSHRAAFDVLTMFQIMAKYDFTEIAERAQSDLVIVTAKVDYENKDKAVENGFRWDPANKSWFKVMRQFDLVKLKFPFSVNVTKSELND